MSKQAASIRCRCPHESSSRKNVSIVACVRSRPNRQRLACLKIADHGQELRPLSQPDLVDPHLLQRGTPTLRGPARQIPKVDRPDGAARESELAANLPGRRGFAGPPHRVFESFAERRLTGQLRHSLDLDAARGTPDAKDFHDDCRAILAPGQVPHFAFGDVHHLAHPFAAPGTNQSAAALSTHPQAQRLRRFVHLMLKHAVHRPAQNFREVVVLHPPSVPTRSIRQLAGTWTIPAQSPFFIRDFQGPVEIVL